MAAKSTTSKPAPVKTPVKADTPTAPPAAPKSAAKKPAAPRPARRPSSGDVTPSRTPGGIKNFVVKDRSAAARDSKIEAIHDIVAHARPGEGAKLAQALKAVVEGASPDDVEALKDALLQREAAPSDHPDDELAPDWRDGGYPYRRLMTRKNYEKQKYHLQVELLKLQAWVKETGQKVVILFEGRDAAGKGGVIKRISEPMNPRGCRVVALGTPTERERTQWYFQRYVEHLPSAGEIVLFDRSWYNRAGVEKVMGFCTREDYREFLRSCPEFERLIVRSGIKLLKYWFSVSDEEQERRFQARVDTATKRWKLSPMDLESRRRWEEYSRAKDVMFEFTDIGQCRWCVVNSNDKRRAALNCIRHLLGQIPYQDVTPPPIELPPRQPSTGYQRPPIGEQSFVPDFY